MSRPTLALAILACFTATVTRVAAVVPPSPEPVTSTVVVVNNSPGNQTDSHVSGDLASYTDGPQSSSIRYYRFSTGADAAIPLDGSLMDLLSDVSGDRITFSRVTAERTAILVYDVAAGSSTEIDPHAGSSRLGTAIGGGTIVFVDFGTGTMSGDIMVADLSNPSTSQTLSSSPAAEGSPNVSTDGNVAVWELCPTSQVSCDVMKAVRTGTTWSATEPVANSASPEGNPDTDGVNIVWDADYPLSFTGKDIYYQPVIGGAVTQLQIPGPQNNPSISRGVISFESVVPGSTSSDPFVYVIATNRLYQVTHTPTINETLSDVDVLANGDIRVVWSADDGFGQESNVYATTFTPAGTPGFRICPLYDPLVAKKSGAVYPIKIQLCDASGRNLSSPSVVLHAISVTQTSTNAPGPLDDAGNANPDYDFRYDAGLGGYIFNLSLRGLPRGTYDLNFRAGTDPALYTARFAVK